jgi:hypothetical protein
MTSTMRHRFSYKCIRCGTKYYGYCPDECSCSGRTFHFIVEHDDLLGDRIIETIHK